MVGNCNIEPTYAILFIASFLMFSFDGIDLMVRALYIERETDEIASDKVPTTPSGRVRPSVVRWLICLRLFVSTCACLCALVSLFVCRFFVCVHPRRVCILQCVFTLQFHN